MEYFEQWSDEKILSTCVWYGEEARKWKNKFLGLLPEVERRKLYEQKGFASVVHFAQVIGGVSEKQVKRALSLYDRFEETPVLRELLTSGEVSVNKLARVASVARPDNEEFLVSQVQMLSKSAVETLVRDIQQDDMRFVPGHKTELDHKLELAEDVERELAELQGKGIDIDAELRLFLEQRKMQIEQQKETVGESCKETDKRHIPQRIRDLLAKEYGTKCSIKTCKKPSEEIHHAQRWSLSRNHDPRYLAPLCKEHHQVAHARDVRVQEIRVSANRRT